MTVTFIIAVIILIVVLLAIYFLQMNKPGSAPVKETATKKETKAPEVADSAKTQEPIDPFKSAVPPRE